MERSSERRYTKERREGIGTDTREVSVGRCRRMQKAWSQKKTP
jgi:hypothetical protein